MGTVTCIQRHKTANIYLPASTYRAHVWGEGSERGYLRISHCCCCCWVLVPKSLHDLKLQETGSHQVEEVTVIHKQHYPGRRAPSPFRVQKGGTSPCLLAAFLCFPMAMGRLGNIVKHLTLPRCLRSFHPLSISRPRLPPNLLSFVQICLHHRSTCCVFELQHYLLIQRFIFNEAPCQCLNSIQNKEKAVFPKQLLL